MKRILTSAVITIFALIAGIGFDASAQQSKRLTADKHNEYGLIYSLPRTALRIEVTAEREIRKAGPFYQYAKKYIGTDKAITKDSENWKIISVNISSFGTPDEDEQYLMQLKPGTLTFLSTDINGTLLGINTDVSVSEPTQQADSELPPSSLDSKKYLQYVDEDFLASQSSAKRAQMLAQSLMEIRDSRIALTRGTAETMPTDGKQLELMLNSLQEQEQSMTDAFCGTTQRQTVTRVYTFIPDEEQEGRSVLFRLSDFAGFVDKDDYSGDPVYIDIKITHRGELPTDDKGETKGMPKDAVAYNIPGNAQITLTHNGNNLFSKEIPFAQFGVVFGLNPSIFTSKKEPSFARFDPATGAILEIGSATIE